jgi:hypothetical protein
MVDATVGRRMVSLLMALWDGALSQGSLMEKVKKSGEFAKDYQPIVKQLVDDGALVSSGEKRSIKITLSEPGRQLLGKLLSDPEFEFGGQIGKKSANVLLAVMRSQSSASPSHQAPVTSTVTVEPIQSYEAFKPIALETFDRLNQDFNMDNLVPIYRIRRAIGDRVSRKDFDSWLLELQATDIFQLLEGSVEDSAPDKIEDSISTRVSGLRCYAKRLDA